MKRICSLILAIIMVASVTLSFSACAKKDGVMIDYLELLNQPASMEVIGEAEEYLNKNIRKVDEEQRDYMVFMYIDYVWNFDSEYISYAEILDSYGGYISEFMAAVYGAYSLEQDDPVTKQGEGAELACDWDEIVKRALAVEGIIEDNKELLNSEEYAYVKDDVSWLYKLYINYMLIGAGNNPLFSHETGEFDHNAEIVYVRLAQANPETVTAWAVNEYFSYLDSINYKLDYSDSGESKVYYDTCGYIVDEAGKKVCK